MERPRHLFRIVYSTRLYPKAEYKLLHKRTLKVHPDHTYSTVPADFSYIPLAKSRLKSFATADTVIVIDAFPEGGIQNEPTSIMTGNSGPEGIPVKIFRMKYIEGAFHFFLSYSSNKRKIGSPQRDDFFLFTADVNKPVIFYINGFFDRGEAGNKTRSYLEQAYYITYSGSRTVKSVPGKKGTSKVNLDLSSATVIDQRKLFY